MSGNIIIEYSQLLILIFIFLLLAIWYLLYSKKENKIKVDISTKQQSIDNFFKEGLEELYLSIPFDDGLNEVEDIDVVDKVEIKSLDENTGVATIVRFKNSFKAKLIQSSDDTKFEYQSVKEKIVSYKKFNSRISWDCDSFNYGRKQLIRISIRGKTLCIYFAFDPSIFNDTKYIVEESMSKKFADTPCLFRLKNPRRIKYALELIDKIVKEYEMELLNEVPKLNIIEDYPYESRKSLINRGLIKKYETKEKYKNFLNIKPKK